MTTFSPPIGISFRSSVTKQYRVLDNEFGDGYSQTTPDGLNPVLEVWNLAWENITDSQANAIEAFFDANVGQGFNWTTPRGETKRFIASTPTRTFTSYNSNSLTVTLTEKPGVI